jgi:subtilisin family serine protease
MKSTKICFVALSIFALALVPSSTISQSPSDKATNFVKVPNAIPNQYIVVLSDGVVSSTAPLDVRRSQVSAIADRFAQVYGGKVSFLYETALKGFSIEELSEEGAFALSKNRQIKLVEEVGSYQVSDVQLNPPWGLDRIDQMSLPVNGQYVYNATGAGVTAYIIDTGIRTTHVEFGGRASIAADFIAPGGEAPCVPTATNNDCSGHGTHTAGTVGSGAYGVAKGVTIRSVKVCFGNFRGCPTSAILEGVDFVTQDHLANASVPAVVNMSLGGFPDDLIDATVRSSINSGVTYVVAAGNFHQDASGFSPARVAECLTIGASGPTDQGAKDGFGNFFSNFGTVVDNFAPGENVLSAGIDNDTAAIFASGTSMASPHTAGAVALYLQGRVGTSACDQHPIAGIANTSGGAVSTCPDRVNQFIKSNTSLNKLSDIGPGSANRLLFTGSLPTTTNPIDNQRFFVWEQYADFPINQPEPDEGGLDFWTGNITGTCGTGFNDNNGCTHQKRIDVSRAFFVAAFPSLFTGGGNQLTDNPTFVHKCYEVYLRRSVSDSDPGFQFWLNDLNGYGIPANQNGINHLIDAFLGSGDYRQRFGQP